MWTNRHNVTQDERKYSCTYANSKVSRLSEVIHKVSLILFLSCIDDSVALLKYKIVVFGRKFPRNRTISNWLVFLSPNLCDNNLRAVQFLELCNESFSLIVYLVQFWQRGHLLYKLLKLPYNINSHNWATSQSFHHLQASHNSTILNLTDTNSRK